MSTAPIEIHVIADSTGDTAARVARAAQAQFVRHPTPHHPPPADQHRRGPARRSSGRRRDGQRRRGLLHPGRSTGCASGRGAVLSDRRARCDLLGTPRGRPRGRQRRPGRAGAGPSGRPRPRLLQAGSPRWSSPSGTTTASPPRAWSTPTSSSSASRGRARRRCRCTSASWATRPPTSPWCSGIEPRRALFQIDRGSIVGLTIEAERLATIRGRACVPSASRVPRRLCRAQPHPRGAGRGQRAAAASRLPVLDTTSLALEEAAGRVIELVDDRRRIAAGTP